MATKKFIALFSFLMIPLWLWSTVASIQADARPLRSQVIAHAGESYTGEKDPAYISYDQALRVYMVERIKGNFGVTLDPKTYSGFDLLEIEAFLKCKKSNEPIDDVLKMFSGHP